MAKKSFEIQGAKLRLGGLDLEAGTTNVVIPGITAATTYFVEEVEGTDVNQANTFIISPIVIDDPTYNDYDINGTSAGRAEYSCELDGDGYIDKVELFDGGGTYTDSDIADANMWAYIGTESNPFTVFTTSDWIEIPFRPVFRAGAVDNTVTSTYKFETGIFGTKDNPDTGGWGDYNMYLDPGGESDAGIEIPSVDAQTSGSPLIIYNNKNANNDIQLSVHGGTFLFAGDGSLTFPDTTVQTTAYSGGQGHMFMIDTNRTDTYTEVGNADKPFKTFAAAIAAAETTDTTVTFVLMGCTVTEDVNFANTSFTSVTIATSCRSVISGNITIADVPAMSQMFFRNIEVGGTFTITGDGTSEQFNSVNFYNTSFTGPVNITATNATAFYEVAFFDTVNFTNLSYLYINGAQFNADWTITADDTGTYPIPSRGINPGTGGSISIIFGTIANNVLFVKGGTAAYVFQPHMTRLGRTTESYTIPSGWTVSAYGADFRGTWTNNGTMSMKISGTDNRVLGTAPSYSSIVGGDRVIADLAPANSKGVAGDRAGMIAASGSYLYVCTANYTTGVDDIWSRTAITATTW